jgi:hypothetical protein
MHDFMTSMLKKEYYERIVFRFTFVDASCIAVAVSAIVLFEDVWAESNLC